MAADTSWQRYRRLRCDVPALGLTVDPSRMRFDDAFVARTEPLVTRAFDAMEALERGAIANPDENRRVGHYWLRAPALAPDPETRREIEDALGAVKRFASDVVEHRIHTPQGQRVNAGMPFQSALLAGIGGSALGPMFVADALGEPDLAGVAARGLPGIPVHVLDNTDPEGFVRAIALLAERGLLDQTLVLVTSKSGGTPETRNAMIAVRRAMENVGLDFPPRAVAITQRGSQLDRTAEGERWLARFPMWDWVGGRTSVTSAVGLVPMALQGLDVDAFLAGAATCDEATRVRDPLRNPAMLLALTWLHATGGVGGRKAMVVLPYKDRLVLLSRYLQQLVMESLGKRLDLAGNRVDQGLTVYGNKGSTDQHAFVQQLRDGANDFFATFIRVLDATGGLRREELAGPAGDPEVEPGVTAGDYLHGLLLGTRAALHDNERESITITVPRVDERTVGALIALFERAVGFYASLVGVNAYHQPGVEAGKKAAAAVLALQTRVVAALDPTPRSAEAIAIAIGEADVETVLHLLEHLAANGRARREGEGPSARFARA
ncbi:MAG TPA: glucose-6-phosphate isomerase [Anaeromyxobacteraceae bacterium]|nr:glucose-6-phosphate isomerase [Anaeromyxobacteraceae bacterium]